MSASKPEPQLMAPGSHYGACYFSGCGFLLPFHFGVVLCLRDNGITFEVATGASGGVMAALAVLKAADLEVGIRQSFDLRQETVSCITSVSAFRKMLKHYFFSFRRSEFQKAMTVESLRGRFRVLLGLLPSGAATLASDCAPGHRWTPAECSVSHWLDEPDLADACSAASYIPGGTALLPAYVRGHVAIDAMIPQIFLRHGDQKDYDMRWPRGPLLGGNSSLRLLCVPFSAGPFVSAIVEHDEHTILVQGEFHTLMHFWTPTKVMRKGFLSGYAQCQAAIKSTGRRMDEREIENKLDAILKRQQDWKDDVGFEPPSLALVRDSMPMLLFFVLPLMFAIQALFLCCWPQWIPFTL